MFVNKNPATNEFRLVYSNVTGESTNLEWIRKIEQNEIPELGNDFNDNYLKPKINEHFFNNYFKNIIITTYQNFKINVNFNLFYK